MSIMQFTVKRWTCLININECAVTCARVLFHNTSFGHIISKEKWTLLFYLTFSSSPHQLTPPTLSLLRLRSHPRASGSSVIPEAGAFRRRSRGWRCWPVHEIESLHHMWTCHIRWSICQLWFAPPPLHSISLASLPSIPHRPRRGFRRDGGLNKVDRGHQRDLKDVDRRNRIAFHANGAAAVLRRARWRLRHARDRRAIALTWGILRCQSRLFLPIYPSTVVQTFPGWSRSEFAFGSGFSSWMCSALSGCPNWRGEWMWCASTSAVISCMNLHFLLCFRCIKARSCVCHTHRERFKHAARVSGLSVVIRVALSCSVVVMSGFVESSCLFIHSFMYSWWPEWWREWSVICNFFRMLVYVFCKYVCVLTIL